MTVATRSDPNYTSMLAAAYKAAIDAAFAVDKRMAAAFAPHEQDVGSPAPDMSVRIDAGFTLVGETLAEVAAQTVSGFTVPASGYVRVDRVVLDPSTGLCSRVAGTAQTTGSPTAVAPDIPGGRLPICQIAFTSSSTAITNSMITDERVRLIAESSSAICEGRITLTSAAPVPSTSVTGATTVYCTPYKGNKISLYDGTRWVTRTFSEMSQATTDSTKSPAAVANSSNYDLFVWDDVGTLRCTRGPAWSTSTARGTGAATTELELFEGRYVNKVAITNGPAARRGLYVGSIRSDGSAQINDSSSLRHVWNNYNRVERSMGGSDSTNSWTYSTAAYRLFNNNSNMRLDFLVGLAEDALKARCIGYAFNSTATGRIVRVGIGLDSTSSIVGSNNAQAIVTDSIASTLTAHFSGGVGLGHHQLNALEYGAGSDTQTWIGDGGDATVTQTGISGEVWA